MPSPILARIAISDEEWAAIRKRSIDEGLRPSELLAAIVRKYLSTTPKGKP